MRIRGRNIRDVYAYIRVSNIILLRVGRYIGKVIDETNGWNNMHFLFLSTCDHFFKDKKNRIYSGKLKTFFLY